MKGHKSIFLAVEFEDATRRLLREKLWLDDVTKQEIRVQPRRNLHMTVGYIADVSYDHREDVMRCFDPLKELAPFMAKVEGSGGFGPHETIMCATVGPRDQFENLHKTALNLLTQKTPYSFDQTYQDYVPHLRLFNIKQKVPEERRQEIKELFDDRCHRKIDFKIKSLALMERVKDHYAALRHYVLRG